MLGLADRSRIIDLFEALMKGDVASALANLREQYDSGADPAQILVELAEFVHFVTRTKVAPDLVDAAATEVERQRGGGYAQSLSMSVLSRAWQILLKGVQEVRDSPRPLAAADMVLVRLAYASELPSPEEALRRFVAPTAPALQGEGLGAPPPRGGGSGGSASAALRSAPRLASSQADVAPSPAPAPDAAPSVTLKNFADLVALAGAQRDIQTKIALERDVRLVRFEQGRLEFSLAPGGSASLPAQLARKLQDWTGQRWMVALSSAEGAASLVEQADAKERQRKVGVQAHPLVRAALEQFPGAVIVAVRGGEAELAPAPRETAPLEAEDVGYGDESADEDF